MVPEGHFLLSLEITSNESKASEARGNHFANKQKSRILIYFGLIKVKKVQRYDPGGTHCTNLVYFYKLNVFRVSLKTTSMQIQWKLDAK